MAKGSVRKKGKKWYYRFYVEDASGNLVQKEFAGTENKSETEKLLRQAMEDYEAKRFVAKAENITLGELLDLWAEEELKTGTLSNGTVGNYLQTIGRIKQHPISKRKLKTVTSVHLQEFMDLLSFGGTVGDFISKGYSIDYVRSFSAVLQQSFRFAVFPKQFITFNPMQYVVMRHKKEETDLFADETATDRDKVKPLSFEMYRKLIEQLGKRSGDAILPVQIAYFTGLRLGEVAGRKRQDINLEEQYLTVRRSIRYNGATHKHEIGPTKWKKIRVVDFGDTLADILRNAKKEQHKNRFQYGELYQRNFYREVMEKNRVHYEYYHLGMTENVPEDYTEIFFVCLREDGCLELPATIETACRTAGSVPPVAVAAGFRQAAVEVAQGTGALFKARRVVQQEDRAQTALHIGGQLGGARHGQVGRALGLGLLVRIVQRIDVQGHDHLAVAVPVFAELGKLGLERVHGILRQVVGSHHGHIVVGLGGKEILPDEVVRHKGRGDADEDHPLQVIIPPVGPAFFPGILFFPAGFEVAGLDVAFVTIACHSSP